MVNEKIILEVLKEQYQKQIKEVVQNLSTDLLLKTKEKFRDFVVGTVFSIETISDDGVVLRKPTNTNDSKPNTYSANQYSVSYSDLEKYFELA